MIYIDRGLWTILLYIYIFYYYFLPKKSNRPLHLSFFHSFLFIAIFERKADSWIARIASQAQLALAWLRGVYHLRAAIIGFPGFPGFLPALYYQDTSGLIQLYFLLKIENRKITKKSHVRINLYRKFYMLVYHDKSSVII